MRDLHLQEIQNPIKVNLSRGQQYFIDSMEKLGFR